MDPDYLPASNFAIETIKVILEGAHGFREDWPKASDLSSKIATKPGISLLFLVIIMQIAAFNAGGTSERIPADNNSFSTLRSCVMVSDIKTAVPDPRIRYVLGLQGTVGVSGGNVTASRERP